MTLDRESYFFTPRYTRGKVCKVLDVTRDTLRHYEECGLLMPTQNQKNGYKYYSIADLEILRVILFLRAIDIPIKDIPKFIECKDINIYSSFLDEQIKIAVDKINHWNHIKNILTYLKDIVEDYKKAPQNVSVVENITFKFRLVKFDYNNYDIEKMLPTKPSNEITSHIIKLKIVDKNWVISNRKYNSEMLVGHLCQDEDLDDDICIYTIPQSLFITTLEGLEEIPKIIKNTWEMYNNTYEFSDKVYIIEHAFFNIFNQEALLRNIYLPIIKVK